MARETGLEPATSGVTGRRSNQLSYSRSASEQVVRATWLPFSGMHGEVKRPSCYPEFYSHPLPGLL